MALYLFNNKIVQRRKIHLMFERRVYSAKLGGLVLQLVHYKAPLSCGNHRHRVYLHIKVGAVTRTQKENPE